MDQEMLMALLAQMFQSAPKYDKSGNTKPIDLTYQKDQANYQQDVSKQLTEDPYIAMLAGPQSFNPAAFQDVQDGFDSYDVPSNPLDAYSGLSPDSEEGKIARAIQEGFSPEEIAQQFAAAGYKNGKDDKQIDRVRGLADELYRGNHEYQSQISTLPGFAQGEDGTWQNQGEGQIIGGKLQVPKYRRSDLAQEYDKYGLTTPDVQFGQGDFGYGQDRQMQRQGNLDLLSLAERKARELKGAIAPARERDIELGGQGAQMRALLQRATAGGTTPEHIAGAGYNAHMVPESNKASRLADLSKSPEWAQFAEMTAGTRRSLGAADDRVRSGNAGGQARDEYRKVNHAFREAELSDFKTRRVDEYDQRYAQRMAELHQQSGITPNKLELMQRAMALKSAGG